MRTCIGLWVLCWCVSSGAAAGQQVPGEADALAGPTPPLAIVPFASRSAAIADEWIGPGLAEVLIAELTRRFGVSAVDRDTLWSLARRIDPADDEALSALGQTVGAAWVVAGSYERVGNRLHLSARLIDVPSGTVLHRATAEGDIADFSALASLLARDLADAPPLAASGLLPTLPQAPRIVRLPPTPSPTDPLSPDSPVTAPLTLVPAAIAVAGGPPALQTIRTSEAPVIDGRLLEGEWATAVRITDFVQRSPIEGAPATEATEVYLAYDSTNLYVGIHARYSDPGLIRANRSDRDQLDRDDTVSVYFDPFLDQQRAYVFTINGYGVQGDSILGGAGSGGGGFGGGGFGGGLPRGDASWDALFRSAGTLVEDGWMAEMAIPFKSLRYPSRPSGEPHQWGFQVGRSIQSKNETVVWAPVSRSIAGFLTQMGELRGMTNLSTSRNLEILPTFTAVLPGSLDLDRRRFEEGEFQPEGGVSLKYGLTSDLTADFTFNPDFSQIESDQPQIEVNQRFPLFFEELRPFFLEGQEIFATRGNVNLIHTRTIVDPRYGGKLTGRLGSATLGILVANDEAPGKLDDPTHPAFEQTAKSVIGRLRYDLYPGSYVGAIVTDREFLDAFSRVGGLDGRFRIGATNDLEFRIARASTRDQAGVKRSGATYDIGWGHNGRNLEYGIQHYSVEPGFRTASGFARRTDIRRTGGRVGYRWWPEGWMVNWGPTVDYARNYDFAGVLQDEQVGAGVQFQFARNVRLNVEAGREMERFRGVEFWKSRRQIFAAVGTSRRITLGGGANWGDAINYGPDPFLGRSLGGRVFVTVLPFSRLQSSLNVNFSRLVDPRTSEDVFDVKVFRSQTSYQFTERLLLRNILEYNTFDTTLDANLLLAYRVNAGTVFYIGYDDHYQDRHHIDRVMFSAPGFTRTNRAFFTKFSYLFRY